VRKIKIYFDYICPFCYICKERVKILRNDYHVEFDWKGWEIYPETPKNGAKLEPRKIEGIVKELADELHLKLKSPPYLANSHLALEGAEYAREKGKFEEYHEEVFDAYWKRGKNISRLEILTSIARKIGLEPDDFAEALSQGKFEDVIFEVDKQAERDGVELVPTFVFNGKKIVGNIPFNVMRKEIEKWIEAK